MQIDATLHGRGLGIGTTRIDPLDVTARGPLATLRVSVSLVDQTDLALSLHGRLVAVASG